MEITLKDLAAANGIPGQVGSGIDLDKLFKVYKDLDKHAKKAHGHGILEILVANMRGQSVPMNDNNILPKSGHSPEDQAALKPKALKAPQPTLEDFLPLVNAGISTYLINICSLFEANGMGDKSPYQVLFKHKNITISEIKKVLIGGDKVD